MSSAADKLRAKAARLSGTSSAAAQPEPPNPAPGSYPPPPQRQQDPTPAPCPAEPARKPSGKVTRMKPVRMTLDLAPALHADFEDWTTRTSRELGRGRVVRADVLRVLVRQLLEDEDIQGRVKDVLRREG
jgi:hypothetical protein